ncbi:hypothetical protein [Kitasatospora sp. NPDC059327]|uniref:hypothetical protein n=1 Tax=Kitasatospora sp. NPDC059327 TaxID=3346803 RepID=UPI00369A41C9
MIDRIRAQIEKTTGPFIDVTPVTERRGSTVWKAVAVYGVYAVKAGYGEGEEITAREASVLDRLPGYSVTSGRFEGGGWYVTPWLRGPSTWGLFAPVRESGVGHGRALRGAVGLCRAVAELHAAGWVHCDLQPAHAVHTDQGVRLLDLSWAWHPGFEQHPAFMGGMTHLVAPELAASIQAGVRPVKPTEAAEVYALAGTLWTCITGGWPLDYATAGINPQESGPDVLRTAIATGGIPLASSDLWPAFQEVLRTVLLASAEVRPTAAALAGILESTAPPKGVCQSQGGSD